MDRRTFTEQLSTLGLLSLGMTDLDWGKSLAQIENYDLIIAGAGTAGIPCAIAAAENGAKVLLVEKSDQVGGTLHISGGHMSGGGTKRQKAMGIEDSPQAHYEDVIRICRDTADRRLVQIAVEEAPKTLDWLDELGFEFAPESPRIVYGHVPYQVARTYYGKEAGKSILKAILPLLEKYIQKGDIRLLLQHSLTGLVKEKNVFIGVKVQSEGKEKYFKAKHIVLATGGYAANTALFAKLHSGHSRLLSTAALTSQGDGIQLATSHKAAFRWADKHISSLGGVELEPGSGRVDFWTSWAMLFTTAYRPPREVYVNADARRFMKEDEDDPDIRERIISKQKGECFWAIFDEKGLTEPDEKTGQTPSPILIRWSLEQIKAEAQKGKALWQANDLDELAKKTGLPSVQLNQTIDNYNRCVADNLDEYFGRKYLFKKIENPPFYALKSYCSSLISFGGLHINENFQVLDKKGKTIEGLYAIGEIIGAAATSGNAFCGGMLITPAMSFGRILGKRLAKVN